MSPGRTFALLAGLAAVALAVLVVLTVRLAPCVAVGSVCLFAAAESACRLVGAAGLARGTPVLGWALLLLAGVTLGRTGWSAARQVRATRRFVAGLVPSPSVPERRRLGRSARRVGIEGRADLVDGAEALSLCHGFVRPRVAVSLGLVRSLAPRQLEAVLWHERHHLERRDPLRLLIGRALRAGLFWLPVLGALERYFETVAELAADRRVVAVQAGPASLAGALYRLLTAGRPALGGAAVAGMTPLARRVDHLLDPTLRSGLELGARERLAAVAVALVAACLLVL